MADKMLDRLSKILAQAENAGTPEEAETFMAKALQMSAATSIDLAVARAHRAEKEKVEEVVKDHRVQVNPNNRRHNRKHFVDLALAIVETNDCEALISGNERAVFVTGFPSDIAVIEALFAHLSAEMVIECDRALKQGANKEVRRVPVMEKVDLAWEDRAWGQWNGRTYYDENPDDDIYCYKRPEETVAQYNVRLEEVTQRARNEYLEAVKKGVESYNAQTDRYRKPVPPPAFREVHVLDAEGNRTYEEKEVSTVDGRVFRNTFYEAFVMKIKRRLWEVKRQAQKDAGEKVEDTESVALALRDKQKEVKEAFEERLKVGKVGSYTGAAGSERQRDYSGVAFERGAKAADAAPLGTTGRGVKST